MTVQELIEALSKIEDTEVPVVTDGWTGENGIYELNGVLLGYEVNGLFSSRKPRRKEINKVVLLT